MNVKDGIQFLHTFLNKAFSKNKMAWRKILVVELVVVINGLNYFQEYMYNEMIKKQYSAQAMYTIGPIFKEQPIFSTAPINKDK